MQMRLLAGSWTLAATTFQHPGAALDPPDVAGVMRCELAGNPLESYPHFEHVRAFMEGAPISIAVDPTRRPEIAGWTGRAYVVRHKDPDGWVEDPTLVDARGAPQDVAFAGDDVQGNTILLAGTNLLRGDAFTSLGAPYDLVLDTDDDGQLDAGDWIDGLDGEPGFFVVRPTQLPGPLAVTETLYSGGTFLGQDLYYPTRIAALGKLPLVVVSHGNGHLYTWYDHVGTHLASYGCIVMSHQNQTQPGIETAAATTLSNTEYFLSHLDTIAGGALAGHVDHHRIVWIGHSRGGEGVVRAYDRIVDGTYAPVNFERSDIVLVSSIAPTVFFDDGRSEPHDVPYHVWVGGADDDVDGCANREACQSFHLFDRATGTRQSISLHGVGHGAFHDGPTGLVASGPCIVSRPDTHAIMKSYLLPLVKRYTEGSLAAEEFLWRQWERFHSPGVPENPCVVVDLQYLPGPSVDRFVVDDFQTQMLTTVSSSGGAVVSQFPDLVEERLDDPNFDFANDGDPMNGMTMGGPTDATKGITFGWIGEDKTLKFRLTEDRRDVRPYTYLSFRACQCTRNPQNEAFLGDQLFQVGLQDSRRRSSFIGIGAYGGGIEVPYQRIACGAGVGWNNEFETIRIRLEDFTRNGAEVDLSSIDWIVFRFGPAFGSKEGKIGFDDLELDR